MGGFANRCMLTSAHVIPNVLLEFEVCSYLAREDTKKVKIQKINLNEYSVKVYSKEYTGYVVYCPLKAVTEILTKAELTKKLSNIKEFFWVYPFLALPLGNCFGKS